MARPKRWVIHPIKDGVMEVRLESWRYLHDYIHQRLVKYPSYIWRGERRDDWLLLPSFDRVHQGVDPAILADRAGTHLERFKFAARGRRGPNPPRIDNENDWWALGQHNGLATPLLDWSISPFLALFFAFIEEGREQSKHRAIYAFHHYITVEKSKEISQKFQGTGRPPIVEFVRPMSDENARLVSQGGLFTRGPAGIDLEQWVRTNFPGYDKATLIKIRIPDTHRVLCLQTLSRMNINHLSLFPDLHGASMFCNVSSIVSNYATP